jgi:predicted phage terminase large subunit-like protein
MQRLHEDDLTGYLLPTGNWAHLCLPAITSEDRCIEIGPGRFKHWRSGEPLQEEREGLEVLKRTKQDAGSQRFAAQYLQQPVPAGGNLIKRGWLQFYDQAPERQPGDRVVQSWDIAAETGDNNDYSACTTWLIRRNFCYLLHVFRGRLPSPELRRKVIAHAGEHRPDTVLIEKAGFGLLFLQELRAANLPPWMPLPIGVTPKGDKKDRLLAHLGKIEGGQVYLPREAPWLADFLQEVLAFPNGRHDDQVESLSQLLSWLSNHNRLPFSAIGLPIYGSADD